MFFLLRMAFWLSIVLILLPSGASQPVQSPNDVGASEAISDASATVQDVRGFCIRQPDACSVGSQVAVSLGYRAQAGAKMLYDFLTEKLASHDGGSTSRLLALGSGFWLHAAGDSAFGLLTFGSFWATAERASRRLATSVAAVSSAAAA